MIFDDALLEAPPSPAADARLRALAMTGARIRTEFGPESLAAAADFEYGRRPRGVIAVGPEARLVRAVLEPTCPVPFMAWPFEGLPAWVGALDLVVVLAPQGSDPGLLASVAEAVRRGAAVVLVATPDSPIAEVAASRSTLLLPSKANDPLAASVSLLAVLHEFGLGPVVNPELVAQSADLVAEESSPHRDLATNPAKDLALNLAEAQPLVWGGTVLAARASRRIAEALRRANGRPALSADANELLPLLVGTERRDPFADPFESEADLRPVLVVLDDCSSDVRARTDRTELLSAAAASDVRVCSLQLPEHLIDAGPMEQYVTLLLKGLFGAAWLQIGSSAS